MKCGESTRSMLNMNNTVSYMSLTKPYKKAFLRRRPDKKKMNLEQSKFDKKKVEQMYISRNTESDVYL